MIGICLKNIEKAGLSTGKSRSAITNIRNFPLFHSPYSFHGYNVLLMRLIFFNVLHSISPLRDVESGGKEVGHLPSRRTTPNLKEAGRKHAASDVKNGWNRLGRKRRTYSRKASKVWRVASSGCSGSNNSASVEP